MKKRRPKFTVVWRIFRNTSEFPGIYRRPSIVCTRDTYKRCGVDIDGDGMVTFIPCRYVFASIVRLNMWWPPGPLPLCSVFGATKVVVGQASRPVVVVVAMMRRLPVRSSNNNKNCCCCCCYCPENDRRRHAANPFRVVILPSSS